MRELPAKDSRSRKVSFEARKGIAYRVSGLVKACQALVRSSTLLLRRNLREGLGVKHGSDRPRALASHPKAPHLPSRWISASCLMTRPDEHVESKPLKRSKAIGCCLLAMYGASQ